jgi:hypothetical protein
MKKLSAAEYERLCAEAQYRIIQAQEGHMSRMRTLDLAEKEAQVRKAVAEAETHEKIRALVLEADKIVDLPKFN